MNREYDKEFDLTSVPVGKVAIIPTKGSEDLAAEVSRCLGYRRDCTNYDLSYEQRKKYEDVIHTMHFNDYCLDNYVITPVFQRFDTGEGKCVLRDSVRNTDVFIICDVFNRYVTSNFYGEQRVMSPDEHYSDLKRLLNAINGKANRITVIMPMLYCGRQHKRTHRESLDAPFVLQELVAMGVDNIITFDAHDPRIQGAIPLHTFEDFSTRHQMIKAINNKFIDQIDPDKLIVVSPDEGGFERAIHYSKVLGTDLTGFYKRRDTGSVSENGGNVIKEHIYLGDAAKVKGADIIIIDDMISSGGSIKDCILRLNELGARHIYVCCAFGIFSAGFGLFDELYEQGKLTQVFTTNLVHCAPELLTKPWYTQVDMCKFVAMIIDRFNQNASLASLVDPDKRTRAKLKSEKYAPVWGKHIAAVEAAEEAARNAKK